MSKEPRHTPEFYAQLKQLLAESEITSCAYFGFGDFQVLELMAIEQSKRVTQSGKTALEAFHLACHCDEPYDSNQWGATILYYSEGIGKKADLFINDSPSKLHVPKFIWSGKLTTKVVLSSCPQSLDNAPEDSSLKKGFLVYRIRS